MYKSYYHEREDYYKGFLYPKSLAGFSAFEKMQNEGYPSIVPVRFRDLSFGAPKEDMSKQLGRHRFEITETYGKNNYHVFFHKETINGMKVVTQTHFINNLFFYSGYSFRYLESREFGLIKKLLFAKYTGVNGLTSEKNEIIRDVNNNQIIVQEDVLLKISYLCNDPLIHQQIAETVNYILEQRNRVDKSLYSDLIMKI